MPADVQFFAQNLMRVNKFFSCPTRRVAKILQWDRLCRGLGAEPPADENFCIFYLIKVNVSAFICVICCNTLLCPTKTAMFITSATPSRTPG